MAISVLIATCARFDKLAASLIVFVLLTFIQRYLRILDPSDRT